MAPLPDVLPLTQAPAFVDHLLREFGEPMSLRDVPVRSSPERATTVPPMEWEVSTWTPGNWEVRLARPTTPGAEPRLQVRAPTGWALRCKGTQQGLITFRIDADNEAWKQVEQAVQKFWSPELEWLWPPTVPKKWRKFPSREPIVNIVRHTGLVPGAEVLLASLSAHQPLFALSVANEGPPLSVNLLGPLNLGGSSGSERWLCELKPGAPLPRLAEVFPGSVEGAYEPLPDAPKPDRLVAEGEPHGLLVCRRGEPGRELYEVHRFHAELVRECRFTLGQAHQVAALSPEDPTAWTVEWAVNGNYNYLAGHPSGFFCMFGRSLPPAPGAARQYELFMHGLSEPSVLSWLNRLAQAGLSVRERQHLQGR
jgi:hypothetical protein